jgi:hypothetical protein
MIVESRVRLLLLDSSQDPKPKHLNAQELVIERRLRKLLKNQAGESQCLDVNLGIAVVVILANFENDVSAVEDFISEKRQAIVGTETRERFAAALDVCSHLARLRNLKPQCSLERAARSLSPTRERRNFSKSVA